MGSGKKLPREAGAAAGGRGQVGEVVPAQRLACAVQLSWSPRHKFQGCVLLFITLFSLVRVTFQSLA